MLWALWSRNREEEIEGFSLLSQCRFWIEGVRQAMRGFHHNLDNFDMVLYIGP